MNREDVICLAKEAGIQVDDGNSFADDIYISVLYRFAALVAEQAKCVHTEQSRCTMGVGDGAGKLFVHGDYDSIKAAQKIVLERDRYKALAGELADVLRFIKRGNDCWCIANTADKRLGFHTHECNEVRLALDKYEQEKGV
jgi:hypothetical protein